MFQIENLTWESILHTMKTNFFKEIPKVCLFCLVGSKISYAYFASDLKITSRQKKGRDKSFSSSCRDLVIISNLAGVRHTYTYHNWLK